MRSSVNSVLLLLCTEVLSQRCNDIETDCYAPWQCATCDISRSVGRPVGTVIRKFCSTPRASIQDPGYYNGNFCDGSNPSCTCDEKIYRPMIPPYGQAPVPQVPGRQAPETQGPVRQVPDLSPPSVQVPKMILPATDPPRFGKFRLPGDQPLLTFPSDWNPAPPPRRRPNIFYDNLSNVALNVPDQSNQEGQDNQKPQSEGINQVGKDIFGVNQVQG